MMTTVLDPSRTNESCPSQWTFTFPYVHTLSHPLQVDRFFLDARGVNAQNVQPVPAHRVPLNGRLYRGDKNLPCLFVRDGGRVGRLDDGDRHLRARPNCGVFVGDYTSEGVQDVDEGLVADSTQNHLREQRGVPPFEHEHRHELRDGGRLQEPPRLELLQLRVGCNLPDEG